MYVLFPFNNADFRYNACWLPLLAKHSESQIFKGPLVVPVDCEWIWHCHRLNPVGFWTKTYFAYCILFSIFVLLVRVEFSNLFLLFR